MLRESIWIRWLSFSIYQTSFGLEVSRFVVSAKQWLDHCPWLLLHYRRQMMLWSILVRLAGLQCIAGKIIALAHFLGVRPYLLGRVLCTRFQPLRGSICYANWILG
jgi:hypothetical protein